MHRATFEQLIDRATGGNELAWSVLYDRYAPKLRGYAAAQGAGEPDEVVGDVFADLARNLARFTGDESAFRSWAFMIAHNRVIDARRRANRQPALFPVAIGGDVEAEAVQALVTGEITAILSALSEDQRNVLLLRIVADLSVSETARILGKGESAVKATHRRGLARLQERAEILGVTR